MQSIYAEIRIAIHQVWLRRWLALAVAAGVCLLGWLVIALIPNSYESTARVFVQMQSILPGKMGITEVERQKDIDRVRQTLSSAVSLEKVVRGTDLAQRAASDRDVAGLVEVLRKDITVKSTQDNLFEISARSSGSGLSDRENAKLAKAITQKLIDIFVEENLAGDRAETSQTIQFLDGELARRAKGLQEAEQRRALFEQKYMGLLPGIGSIEQRMEAARLELSQIDMNLAQAQGSLAAVNGQMAGTPASVATPSGGGGAVGGAQGRISALEGQIAEGYSKGWTDLHPDMVAARSQIGRLRGQAASEGRGGGGGMTANPLYVSLRSMVAEKQAMVSALSARKAQIEGDIAAFTAKQAEEPGVMAEQQRLNRDYDVLKQQYDKLLGDREEVRLRSDVASKTDAIKFRVIDPPSDPRVPVAPNRLLLLAGVLLLGLGAGVAAAFALAQLRPTYSTADRLAAASGLPVLGAIGEVLTVTQQDERRQKLKLFAAAAGGLVGCFALLMLVELVQRGLV